MTTPEERPRGKLDLDALQAKLAKSVWLTVTEQCKLLEEVRRLRDDRFHLLALMSTCRRCLDLNTKPVPLCECADCEAKR